MTDEIYKIVDNIEYHLVTDVEGFYFYTIRPNPDRKIVSPYFTSKNYTPEEIWNGGYDTSFDTNLDGIIESFKKVI